MGADEYYWSPADFDGDERVNFLDYAILAGAWQTNDPNISLDDDNDVDIDDLALFCEDWLWEAGWGDTQWMMAMGGGTDGGLMLPTVKESMLARPERLIAKSQKFYDITPAKTISARRKTLEAEQENVKDIIEWLDAIWLNGELDWTEQEYLEFRKSLEYLLQ
jgi:hypothetical protein